MRSYFSLVYETFFRMKTIFDRIFDGDDMLLLILIDVFYERRECG